MSKNGKNDESLYITLGISIGVSLGLFFGVIADNIPLGLIFGSGGGSAIGTILYFIAKKKIQ